MRIIKRKTGTFFLTEVAPQFLNLEYSFQQKMPLKEAFLSKFTSSIT